MDEEQMYKVIQPFNRDNLFYEVRLYRLPTSLAEVLDSFFQRFVMLLPRHLRHEWTMYIASFSYFTLVVVPRHQV